MSDKRWWTCMKFRKDHRLDYPDTGYGAWTRCGVFATGWMIVANREPKKCAACNRLELEAKKP